MKMKPYGIPNGNEMKRKETLWNSKQKRYETLWNSKWK